MPNGSWAPLSGLLSWEPFKIDALGLVTLLGAEEVNAAVGRLVRSRYFEYLPLLGAYVIAGDRFTDKAAGFNLYNHSHGVHTTDISAWLTRWMLSQDFEVTRSVVEWTVTPPKNRFWDEVVAGTISFVFTGFLVAFTVISEDWYGFANAMSMVVSILVRSYVIRATRNSIDNAVGIAYEGARKKDPTIPDYDADVQAWKKAKGNLKAGESAPSKPAREDYAWKGNQITLVIVQSDSKIVTMKMPGELIAPPSVFIANPKPYYKARYDFARWVGWLAFAVHVVTLGQAVLSTQLYSVALLVIPTILFILRVGCDDSTFVLDIRESVRTYIRGEPTVKEIADDVSDIELPIEKTTCWIGSRLKARVYEWPLAYEFTLEGGKLPAKVKRSEKRQHLYAWLQLTTDEESSMDKWDLFPHKRGSNKQWMDAYKNFKERIRRIQAGDIRPSARQDSAKVPSTTLTPDPNDYAASRTAADSLGPSKRAASVSEQAAVEREEDSNIEPLEHASTEPTENERAEVTLQDFVPQRPIRQGTTHSVTNASPNSAFWMTSENEAAEEAAAASWNFRPSLDASITREPESL